MAGEYLDLNLLINGTMDAFLLVLTGRLLDYPIRRKRVLAGVLIGEVAVLLNVWLPVWWLNAAGLIVSPVMMLMVTFGIQASFWRALVGLWLLAAGLGGLVYVFASFHPSSLQDGMQFTLVQGNLWIMPAAALLWWFGQKSWQRWQFKAAVLKQHLYELEIVFSEAGERIRVVGMVDTGNQLRDPLSGSPVILLEEQIALAVLPEAWIAFVQSPWRDVADPWPLLWQNDGFWLRYFVFIPFKGIDRQSFLIGIHPKQIICQTGSSQREILATVALVPQALDGAKQYQALLHSEHICKGG